jgi:hypothetical protein
MILLSHTSSCLLCCLFLLSAVIVVGPLLVNCCVSCVNFSVACIKSINSMIIRIVHVPVDTISMLIQKNTPRFKGYG